VADKEDMHRAALEEHRAKKDAFVKYLRGEISEGPNRPLAAPSKAKTKSKEVAVQPSAPSSVAAPLREQHRAQDPRLLPQGPRGARGPTLVCWDVPEGGETRVTPGVAATPPPADWAPAKKDRATDRTGSAMSDSLEDARLLIQMLRQQPRLGAPEVSSSHSRTHSHAPAPKGSDMATLKFFTHLPNRVGLRRYRRLSPPRPRRSLWMASTFPSQHVSAARWPTLQRHS